VLQRKKSFKHSKQLYGRAVSTRMGELCKNGRTDRDAVRAEDPRVTDGCVTWLYKARIPRHRHPRRHPREYRRENVGVGVVEFQLSDGLHQQSYYTPGPVSTGMGDCLRTCTPPCHLNRLYPSHLGVVRSERQNQYRPNCSK